MPALALQLPATLGGFQLGRVIGEFVQRCEGVIPTSLCIDFSNLNFIEPTGVTFLSNFIAWLNQNGASVVFHGHDIGSPPLRFLDDSLFFLKHLGSKLSQASCPRQTTQPLIDVHHEHSHSWLTFHVLPWLSGRLAVAPTSLDPFQVCVSEIFNNINDHSTLQIGSFFAQHFPNVNRVSVAVADFGRGIPDRVRQMHPELSDCEAIMRAVQPGFTTNSVRGNRGVGLDYLLTTVVGTNEGMVTIFSLNGIVTFWKSGAGINARPYQSFGFCPGTTIDISLRTDTLHGWGQGAEAWSW